MWDDCCIMNEIEATILGQFEDKLYRLRHKYQEAVEQNKKFREALQEQKNMLQDLSQRYSALEQKYNNLKQAKVISLSDAEIETTRDRITKLVREIDRCIESLKN